MSKIEQWLVPLLPERGRLALDVGANEGSCTEILAGRFDEVHAFEPNLQIAPQLRKVANGRMNVRVLELAVAEESPLELNLYERSCHASAYVDAELDTAARGEIHARVQVPAASLDQLGYASLHVDFIKIDVEGGELAVLNGARDTLMFGDGPALNVEIHSRANLEACRALLEQAGYAPRHLPHPHAGVDEGHCWLICDRKERP